MKSLNSKLRLSSVFLSCALLFTSNANAQEAAVEHNLAIAMQAEEKKVQHELSIELSYSIKAELDRFSRSYSKVKTQELAVVSKQKKLSLQK